MVAGVPGSPMDIESEHLYISILSLCFTHVSNRYTLAAMFKRDFSDPHWLKERKASLVKSSSRT